MISIVLVIAWMVVIFLLSSMSSEESNASTRTIANKIMSSTTEYYVEDNTTNTKNNWRAIEDVNTIIRKFTHAGVYLVLSILVLNLFMQVKGKLNWKYVLIGIAFCIIYAGTDEFHQSFVDGRTGQIMDVGIDTIGAILGAGMFCLVHKLFSLRKREAKNV